MSLAEFRNSEYGKWKYIKKLKVPWDFFFVISFLRWANRSQVSFKELFGIEHDLCEGRGYTMLPLYA